MDRLKLMGCGIGGETAVGFGAEWLVCHKAKVVEMLSYGNVLREKCTQCTLAFEHLIRIKYI